MCVHVCPCGLSHTPLRQEKVGRERGGSAEASKLQSPRLVECEQALGQALSGLVFEQATVQWRWESSSVVTGSS